MSDTLQVKLPRETLAIHLPAISTVLSETWEERILSDGDTRVLSDGDVRVVNTGEDNYPEIVFLKLPEGILAVHLED